uniref:host specificity protein J n=1 Tax=Bradyrhizobium sp. (strain ORS 278) TaxID=114615 RepID=UPI0002DB89BD|nr:host specificity factor TipJ family phage tail protein [Bradyrhizobium sp. ORS 278]
MHANSLQRHALDGEILSPLATVRVIGRAHPLSSRRVICEVPAGLSIAEILQLCAGSSGADFAVYLGEHPIRAENYGRIRVKPGATVVVVPRLQNNPVWRTVATVVIAVAALVAAPYLAPGIIAAAGAIGVTIAATTAIAIGAGVIMLAGSLALNALFPIRPPELSAQGSGAPLNSIQGANNQANPYGTVPVVLGRHRQSPFYGAKAYTEIVGNDQYLRLLFVLGYGPLQVESIQIGETAIGTYADVQTELRQGYAGDAAVTLYPGQVDEQALSIALQNRADPPRLTGHAPWSDSVVTSVDTDEIAVDFLAPSGINMTDSKGNDISWSFTIEMRYRKVGAASWTTGPQTVFTRSYEPIRRGQRIAVARGQYEVQCQKPLGDADPKYARDQVTWTSLRSLRSAAPISFDKPLALLAVRIRATNQLSGVISTLNCVTTSLVKAWNGSAWVANQPSSWPPDLFRHVLQGPANARPVADSGIDLASLQEWWTYCVANGFKFNKVLTDSASVYDRLLGICAAGRAVPTFIDGKWGVVWDRPADPVVQHFTPRNSWGFKGQRTYAQRPHGWRVPFINAANGWTQDERTVYDDGYDASNATLFERIEFPGVTDPGLIWRHGRFHIAQSRLRPENISLSVGWEHLVCTRGDRVAVTHDAMLVGLASGRVKSIAGQVVTVDEQVTIETGKTYGLTFRIADDARSITRAVDGAMVPGDYKSLTLVGDLSVLSGGELFAFGETGRQTAIYRVRSITHQRDLNATLGLVDDAPEIAAADQGDIPDYDPHVTVPPDPLSLPPRSFRFLEVIDGRGATARALVRLVWQLPRLGKTVSFDVQLRDDDAGGDWTAAAHVLAPTMTVDVPLTSAGIWSFRVRCVFADATVSDWAVLNALNLAGLSTVPGDITNLHIRAVDGQTVLDWTVVDDSRVLFYEIRKGSTWDTGLVVGDAVAQPPWATTGDGVYHVRAYVLSPFSARIYSAHSASITVLGAIIARNIIVSHDEQIEGWTGQLQGGVIDGSFIRTTPTATLTLPWATEIVSQLELSGLHIAIYVSPIIVNIGQAAECRFWTQFEASGILQGDDFLAQTDVLASADVLGTSPTRYIDAFPIWRFATGAGNDVFAPADVFAATDVFSADIAWGDWTAIATGTRVARYFQAGIVLITGREDTSAVGTKFSWFVDVPDRTDDYTAMTVPDTGLDVTFYSGGYNGTPTSGAAATPFNGGPNGSPVPHVQRAIVNGTNGDEVKVTNVTLSGCRVFVVNAGSNVTRAGVNLLVRGF